MTGRLDNRPKWTGIEPLDPSVTEQKMGCQQGRAVIRWAVKGPYCIRHDLGYNLVLIVLILFVLVKRCENVLFRGREVLEAKKELTSRRINFNEVVDSEDA